MSLRKGHLVGVLALEDLDDMKAVGVFDDLTQRSDRNGKDRLFDLRTFEHSASGPIEVAPLIGRETCR